MISGPRHFALWDIDSGEHVLPCSCLHRRPQACHTVAAPMDQPETIYPSPQRLHTIEPGLKRRLQSTDTPLISEARAVFVVFSALIGYMSFHIISTPAAGLLFCLESLTRQGLAVHLAAMPKYV